MIGGRVLDVSALVAFACGEPYAQAVVWTALEENMVLAVPSSALTVAWARLPLERFPELAVLLELPVVVVEVLDRVEAFELGRSLGAVGQPLAVTAGQVARSGRIRGWLVVTAEPGALRSVSPDVPIEELP